MPTTLTPAQLRDTLQDPAIYPHQPETVQIEQTHISIVAVVPPHVYKFKKPVDLGFLDFSSLEQRRHFCHEEVRLNARLSPEIYEGVVPLVQTDGGMRVDPPAIEGSIVEYAVKMRYADPAHTLEERIERGEATTDDIDRVTRRLCAFYQDLEASPTTAAAGWVENLRVNIDENFEQTEAYVGEIIERPAFDALRYFFERELDHHTTLLHQRRAEGHVIEGHGDLRLDHVHITDDRVAILDCIEFNERFRMLDIANDVAFLAMDLDVAGRSDLGRQFIEGMADGLEDPDLLTLQPFYKAYRAHVRAKVEAIRAGEEEVPDADREASRQLACRHAQWALRYAVAGGRPLVVVVMGRPATGKSTQAAAIADALGWAHIASDRTRKRLAGVDRDVRADAQTRERLYTEALSEKTYATLRERAIGRCRTGKGTVLDATYSSRKERDQLRAALKAAGLPYAFVELTASDDALRDRLAARSDAAPTASDARIEDFDKLTDRYEAPNALEDARHVRISAEQPAEDSTCAILKTLIRLHHQA